MNWQAFAPFTALHGLTVAVCAGLIGVLIFVARHIRTKRGELRLRRALAVSGILFWVVYNISWNWNGIDFYNGLPLQLCDVCGIVAPLALLTLNRWPRAALYFWTFTLTLQAFIQPVVKVGPADAMFWAFWMAHTIIFACAVYDLVVLHFRPTWSDFGRTLLVSAAYLSVIVPVNLQLGSNYAYIGNPSPEHSIPPFVQALGPWPQRAVIVVLLAVLGYVVVLVPWLLRRKGAGSALSVNRV